MNLAFSSRRWPLVAKVPVMVAFLVILAAVLMSSGVLMRLTREQESRIAALSGAYLDATAAALTPALARRDVWEAFDALDRSRQSFGALRLRLAAAILPDGRVLAATDPRRLPPDAVLPPDLSSHLGTELATDPAAGLAWITRDVDESGVSLGRLLIEIDVAHDLAERARLSLVLLGANAVLTLVLAALGWWLTRRMLAPVRLLTGHLGTRMGQAPALLSEATIARTSPEFRALFQTYNTMVRSVAEREALAARLAEEERIATLGTLAGSMAHEVNNPLGGMLTALDTITAHGWDAEVRSQSIGLIRRGLEDIRNVVRASLVLYKARPEPAATLTGLALDDLRLLVGPEAIRRGVSLEWENELGDVPVEATLVRQAVLNLLLNAIAASPPRGTVRLSARSEHGRLLVRVSDRGTGLPVAMTAILAAPGAMPAAGSSGLGLWSAVRTARTLGGTIRHEPGGIGTSLILDVPTGSRHAALAA